MEIILTRSELSAFYQLIESSNVELVHFKQYVFEIFYACHKISFKDEDDSIKILKDRNN